MAKQNADTAAPQGADEGQAVDPASTPATGSGQGTQHAARGRVMDRVQQFLAGERGGEGAPQPGQQAPVDAGAAGEGGAGEGAIDGAEAGRGHHSARQPREHGKFAGPPEPGTEGGEEGEIEAAEGGQEPASADDAPGEGEGPADVPGVEEDVEEPAAEGDAGAGEATEELVVALEDNHPLRSRGIEEVPLHPEWDDETRDAVRGALNSWVRHRDVQEAYSRADQMERRAVELEAEVEALRTDTAELTQDPRLQRLLEDVEGTYGEEDGKKLREIIQRAQNDMVRDRKEKAVSTYEQRRAVNQWWSTVEQNASELYPAWSETGQLEGQIKQHGAQYIKRLDQVNEQRTQQGLSPVTPDVREFFRWVNQSYSQDPTARQFHGDNGNNMNGRGGQDREQLKQELLQDEEFRSELLADARKAEEERLKDAASRRSTNPTGGMPPGRQGARTPHPAEGEEEELKQMPVKSQKEARKSRFLSGLGQ